MTGLDTVLSMLARAGIPIANVDERTILFWLRKGYVPHRIVTEIFQVPITAIPPSQEAS